VIRLYDGKAGPPKRDDRFIPLIELIRSWDALDQNFLVPKRWTPTKAEAAEMKRLLYLSARYYCSCGDRHCNRKHNNVDGCPNGGQRISCTAVVVKDAAGHLRTQFMFRDKHDGIHSVIERYGDDPKDWPYLARAKKVSA
jgi:hypothetical protein